MSITLIFLHLAALVGLLAGLWLLLLPNRAPLVLARPASLSLAWLRRSWRVERFFYRRHRLCGGVVLAVSLVVFVVLQLHFWSLTHLRVLTLGLATLLESISLFLLITTPFTFLLGVVIFVRPSAIKGVEMWSNRPITREMVANSLAPLRQRLRTFLEAHPRLLGIGLMLGSGTVFYLMKH